MTKLMRPSLRDITQNAASAHAGLLLQRGLLEWETGKKNQLIERITHTTAPNHYRLALARWIALTRNNDRFATGILRCENRLYTGLATGTTLETGISTHHSYGVPLLAGSSIKGAVRHYAEQSGLDKTYLDELFGSDSEADELSGALVWHDAWWLPQNERDHPYSGEVITVHHQDYYNGKVAEADGTESPIPNQQIATGGGYYFVIEGEADWTRYALGLLNATLEQRGLGGKTASGYGYFRSDDTASYKEIVNDIHNRWQKSQKDADEAARLASLPEWERELDDWQKKLPTLKVNGAGDKAATDFIDKIFAAIQNVLDNPAADAAARRRFADGIAALDLEKHRLISGKKKKEKLNPLLRQLRGEN